MGRLTITHKILLQNKVNALLSLLQSLSNERLRLILLKDIIKIKNILKNHTILLDN